MEIMTDEKSLNLPGTLKHNDTKMLVDQRRDGLTQ